MRLGPGLQRLRPGCLVRHLDGHLLDHLPDDLDLLDDFHLNDNFPDDLDGHLFDHLNLSDDFHLPHEHRCRSRLGALSRDR